VVPQVPKKTRVGTPEWIRTTDLLLRRQTLYPAELRAHTDTLYCKTIGAGRCDTML
jgi:hypothetical protein